MNMTKHLNINLTESNELAIDFLNEILKIFESFKKQVFLFDNTYDINSNSYKSLFKVEVGILNNNLLIYQSKLNREILSETNVENNSVSSNWSKKDSIKFIDLLLKYDISNKMSCLLKLIKTAKLNSELPLTDLNTIIKDRNLSEAPTDNIIKKWLKRNEVYLYGLAAIFGIVGVLLQVFSFKEADLNKETPDSISAEDSIKHNIKNNIEVNTHGDQSPAVIGDNVDIKYDNIHYEFDSISNTNK